MRRKIKTRPFDVAEHLHTDEDDADLLRDAEESGSARYLAHAREIVARAKERRAAKAAK